MIYKQKFSHSCLVAALLAVLPKNKLKYQNKSSEKEILMNGMERKYSFYVVGVPEEFSKKTKEKVVIYVDNKYFTNVLSKLVTKNIKVIHNKIDEQLIRKVLEKYAYNVKKEKIVKIKLENGDTLGEGNTLDHKIFVIPKGKERKIKNAVLKMAKDIELGDCLIKL